MISISTDAFRDAMASLPAGVAVITTWSTDGLPRGATVSALCSLSAEPPLLLVCLGHDSETAAALELGRAFLVNVLAADQAPAARAFAGKGHGKFDAVDWSPGMLGLPQIDGSQATVACRTVERLPGGDHTIVIGAVQDAISPLAGRPMVYWRREFGSFRPLPIS